SNALHRNELLGNYLRRIQQIEIKLHFISFFYDLNAKFPLWVVAVLDRFPQIASMKIRILAGDLLCFIPNDSMQTKQWLPVKLHEPCFAGFIDETKSVNSKSFHHAKASRYCTIRHHPHDHVHRLRRKRDEIPERVVGRSCLWDLVVRFRFHRVNHIRKLDRVLNEEHGDVVADEIEVAFLCVKLDGKTTHVSSEVGGSARTLDCRKAHEDRRPD